MKAQAGAIKALFILVVLVALCVIGFIYLGKIINKPKPAPKPSIINNQTPDSSTSKSFDVN